MNKYWTEKEDNVDDVNAEIFNVAFDLIAEDMEEAQKTAGKSPYIGDNGNWYEWDSDLGKYVDTGIMAEGYTPEKGVDYWTEEDKAEIKDYVSESMTPVEVASCEVTQEAIDAAGEEGITVVTAGNEDVDISGYNEIIMSVHIPNSKTINTENGQIVLYMTSQEGIATGDANKFLSPQSTSIATNSAIMYDRYNVFTVNGLWSGEAFLYGMVIRNGYGTSTGYPGVTNGWNCLTDNFNKNMKKYFHLKSRGETFKFPVGTKMTVYGR